MRKIKSSSYFDDGLKHHYEIAKILKKKIRIFLYVQNR